MDEVSKFIGGLVSLAVFAGLCFGGYLLLHRGTTWTGVYERTTDTRIYRSQIFKTAEECSNWLNQQRSQEQAYPTGRINFECGSNCKEPQTLNGPMRCKETFDN